MEVVSYYEMNLARNGTGDTGTRDGIVVAKIVAMVVLSLATFFLGFVPIMLARWFKWNQDTAVGIKTTHQVERSQKSRIFLSILLSFGGGALLCTTFMHLLPEVTETMEHLQTDGVIGETPFHLTNLVMMAGFFMMYFVEELVHMYLHSREHKKEEQTEIDEVIHRSFSMRKCSTLSVDVNSSSTVSELSLEEGKPEAKGHQHHLSPHSHEGHSHHPNGHSHSHQPDPHGHQTSKNGHSHMVIPETNNNGTVSSFRGLLIVVALSVHELFEGLAVGLESTTGGVYYMFGAVASHKLVLAFCVGLELVSARTRMRLNVVYLATFALVSPVGIGIGIGLSEVNSSGSGVLNVFLQGIASGTLLYVVFFEVLTRQRVDSNANGLLQLLAILIGFGTMFGLLMAAGHEHSDAGDEHEGHMQPLKQLIQEIVGGPSSATPEDH